MYSYFLSCARCRVPDAGDMKPPVLRHRILVSYVPLRAESSANVLRWHPCICTNDKESIAFRNYLMGI